MRMNLNHSWLCEADYALYLAFTVISSCTARIVSMTAANFKPCTFHRLFFLRALQFLNKVVTEAVLNTER
jgi:hypothetical protein